MAIPDPTQRETTDFDCIIVGAGAAGLMCASQAGRLGKRVLVLDHANKVGKKILMSGGGRCNFTNHYVTPEQYISANPHFCKSALSRYTQYDFLDLVTKYHLQYHEKTQGQLFCDHKASDILDILLSECRKFNAVIKTQCQIQQVIPRDNPGSKGFELTTSLGSFSCRSLVIASGGLSIPTMGASGFGYEIARQFGLHVTDVAPALVPFTVSGSLKNLCEDLSGVSLTVRVSTAKQSFLDSMLFTHRGLSGPAILQITNYWQPGEAVKLDFFPTFDLVQEIKQAKNSDPKKNIKSVLFNFGPKKFIQSWLDYHKVDSVNMADLNESKIQSVAALFQDYNLLPGGTEGYRTAEVTKGGVSTDELSSKTFEAKKVPGLFFIGEVIDVTGWLGGFNFQWAWASAYCAAHFV